MAVAAAAAVEVAVVAWQRQWQWQLGSGMRSGSGSGSSSALLPSIASRNMQHTTAAHGHVGMATVMLRNLESDDSSLIDFDRLDDDNQRDGAAQYMRSARRQRTCAWPSVHSCSSSGP